MYSLCLYSTAVWARRGSGIGGGGIPLDPVEEDSPAEPAVAPVDEKEPFAVGVMGVPVPEMAEVPAIGVKGAVELIVGKEGVTGVGLRARPESGCATAELFAGG
jgi:hypothetical protein